MFEAIDYPMHWSSRVRQTGPVFAGACVLGARFRRRRPSRLRKERRVGVVQRGNGARLRLNGGGDRN